MGNPMLRDIEVYMSDIAVLRAHMVPSLAPPRLRPGIGHGAVAESPNEFEGIVAGSVIKLFAIAIASTGFLVRNPSGLSRVVSG